MTAASCDPHFFIMHFALYVCQRIYNRHIWVPLQDDPNDVKFTMLLMQNLDPEERDALVPMSVLDGEGGTTLRKVR